MKSTTEAADDIMANSRKKSDRVAISNPRNDFVATFSCGRNVARLPAAILEAALLINHTPIKRDAKWAGDSFVTMDSPIGESDNSPRVIMKYRTTSHHTDTFVVTSKP